MVTVFCVLNTKNNVVVKLLIFSMKFVIIDVVKVTFVCFDVEREMNHDSVWVL